MNTKDALEWLQKECAKPEGVEIGVDSDEVDIYWSNLHITCAPKDVQRALSAIRTLEAIGAVFE